MTQPNGNQGSATVLVVEDSPTQAAQIKEVLIQAGLRVIWAQNGLEGLKLVEQTRPQLILLDLEMPEMNGMETCIELKKKPDTAGIPIIVFTRHDNPEFARQSFQTGVVDFIPKDAFADTVLLETLRELGFISPNPPSNAQASSSSPEL
jgi:CheY-like chemotaxis protein